MGVAQNSTARVTQVLVFGSIYQGAMLVSTYLSHSHICPGACEPLTRVPPGDGKSKSYPGTSTNPTTKIGDLRWVVNSPKAAQNGAPFNGLDHHMSGDPPEEPEKLEPRGWGLDEFLAWPHLQPVDLSNLFLGEGQKVSGER